MVSFYTDSPRLGIRNVHAPEKSQDRIGDVLGAISDEQLAEQRSSGDRSFTVGARAFFGYFHDTYHVGQTELLRQVAGVDDAII